MNYGQMLLNSLYTSELHTQLVKHEKTTNKVNCKQSVSQYTNIRFIIESSLVTIRDYLAEYKPLHLPSQSFVNLLC